MFTGYEGKLVPLKDTIRSFKEILAGQHDSLPESAFYMVCGVSLSHSLWANSSPSLVPSMMLRQRLSSSRRKWVAINS